MKVSIIIPVYNVEKYIARSLCSAIEQTWDDLEIILINDCTPDNSMKIAEGIITDNPRGPIVRIINHDTNRGLSAARNTGITHSKGKYLFFLDSDDYISTDCIEKLASEVMENDIDFAIGNYKIDGPERAVPKLKLKSGLIIGNDNIIRSFAKELWYVMAWNKLVSKKLVIENNIFFHEGILHEDDIWSFELATVARSMYVTEEITYFYVVNPNSISVLPKMRNFESRKEIISLIYNYITANKLFLENKTIYKFFEKLKSKYFDRIIYFVKDKSFCREAYNIFRTKKYNPGFNLKSYYLYNIPALIQDLHYLLPEPIGYKYFRARVRLKYIMLILILKIKNRLNKNENK